MQFEVRVLRLPLTEEQVAHLRTVRESQLADWRAGCPQIVDELFTDENVVRLKSGMGHSAYLGLDGTIYTVAYGEGDPPCILDDPRDIASCVVRWAGCIGMPELVDSLPSIPENAEVCSLCKGSRQMDWEPSADEQDGFQYYCKRCSGLGWTMLPT